MADNKFYRFEVKLDPQNPIEKKNIDAINEIRKLYKINKRQVLNALLKLYINCINSGMEYPLYDSKLPARGSIETRRSAVADNMETVTEYTETDNKSAGKKEKETTAVSDPEPDFDIQMMENFDPGLFGQQLPD